MIDGCPEGWVGTGIPVCALASGASQPEAISPRTSRDGNLMKERDYIGLGVATHDQGPYPQNAGAQSAQDEMECDDNVELSLGLSLPEIAIQQSARVEQVANTSSHSDHAEVQAELKLASPGAKSQHFWHHKFRVNLSNNDQLQNGNLHAEASNGASVLKGYTSNAQAWSSAPGRFAVPVPKVSTIPAKRPFVEGAGERRSIPSIPNHVVSAEAALPCAMPVPAGMYVWNAEPSTVSASTGVGWQQVHVSMEQGPNHPMAGTGSSAFIHPRPLGAPPPHFKVPQAGGGNLSPSIIKPCVATNGTGPLPQVVGALKAEMENESNTNKAPVVGWPPVRSYRRKNTMQAAQNNQMSPEDLHTKSVVGPSNGSMEGVENMNGSSSKNAFFVKAKLDGVRICRKVDLKAYDSYEGLKSALQDMFQGFVSDNAKLDLVNGNNYVVTHEDKDGECWFVGDGPWSMFVESSVRSLRIMKSMDATSIGDKAAKVSAHVNTGNP